MPRISSPRPLDLTKPFVTSSQSYGSQPVDLSQNLVTWYRDIQGDFVPDLSGRGNTARCAGSGSHDPVTGSIDIPELNSLNYPIRSFDLSDNATSTSNVQHIRTINSSGRTIALDDHSFTDGSQDIPFSLSFWLKLGPTTATQYIATKAAISSGKYEWFVAIDANDRLTFRLHSGGASSPYIQAYEDSAFTALHNGWDHFVLTYNGSGAASGINIYRNGSNVSPTKGGASASSYESMIKTSSPLCLGAILSTSLVPTTSDLRGKIHSFAVWKNREINSTEARALYNAYLNGPGGEIRSGFTSKSPRLQLRELDDHPGSYPTSLRTGDATRAGNLRTNFNDETSIVFSQDGDTVFPAMLPKGGSFASQAVDIIGQESDISASLPIRSFQHPTHLHYSPVEEMGPFDENRSMPATNFYLSGTDPDVLPGFTSPLRSKTSIEIDITSNSDFKLVRNYSVRTKIEHPASTDIDRTGFSYYNHTKRVWEDVGIVDQAGGRYRHDFTIDYNPGPTASSGTNGFMMQFVPGGYIGGAIVNAFGPAKNENSFYTEDEITQLGLRKTGSPTSIALGPVDVRYYASSSQTLRMSDFISHPFLLEKAVLEIDEARFQQVFEASTNTGNSGESAFTQLPVNVSFFIYRQANENRRSLIDEISGSNRFIVASGSAFFYNSEIYHTGYHGPSFERDLNTDISYGNTSYGQFTGSMRISLEPAVSPKQYLGVTSTILTQSGTPSSTLYGSLNHFWPGGTSYRKFNEKFRTEGTSNPTVWNHRDQGVYIEAGSGLPTAQEKMVFESFDSRALRFIGAPENSTGDQTTVSIAGLPAEQVEYSNNPQSTVSPYLLLPQDRLVFGMDLGISIPMNQGKNFPPSGIYNSDIMSVLTGTFMSIPAGKRAKITLFGSTIKDGVEHLSSLNQNLSSDSIHETVGSEAILDQFQVEPISSYYGSYLDEVMTGSMLTPVLGGLFFVTASQDQSRRVVGRVSLGQAGTTGSFQRFTTLVDPQSIVLDSCLPDYNTMLSASSALSEYTYSGEGVPRFSLSSTSQIYETISLSLSKVKQFPFEGDPTRRIKQSSGILSIPDDGVATDRASDPTAVTGVDLDPFEYIYRTGFSFISKARKKTPVYMTEPFYLYGSLKRVDLTQNLVSSYYYDHSAYAAGFIRDALNDSTYTNSLTLVSGTDPSITLVNSKPNSYLSSVTSTGIGAKAFQFQAASTSAEVQHAIASDDFGDHKMSSGGVDFPFTLSITFYSDTSSADALIQRAYYTTSGTSLIEYELSVNSSRQINFKIGYGNTSNRKGITTTQTVPTDTWVHVVATYDGVGSTGLTSMSIYLNGTKRNATEDSNLPGSAMTVSANSRLSIGAKLAGDMEPSSSGELDGYFYSCHIWKNRELTAAEVNDLYDAEFSGVTFGLIKHRRKNDFELFDYSELTLSPGAYRYGISSVNQEFLKANFAANRYGQIRDALEQSRDTALVDRGSPIKIKFLSGSTIVDPMLTYSQNLSTFATSSVPYFDGATKNRPDNPDESLVEVVA